ncbi:transketolase [Candidatus Woesearchaeota archaeon]|nr:transketolase [Candidatus Woesearchaeota archaeon]
MVYFLVIAIIIKKYKNTQNKLKKMQKEKLIKGLKERAKQIRTDVLEMTTKAGSGHPGGSLSAADIITTLYFHKLKHNPKKPNWPDRDRFILSKGHACPALYSALARTGYFDVKKLKTLRKLGSILQGHPERHRCPGVEASTGPLGQGLSFANGVALAGRLDKKDYKVYVLMGDGEIQEGQVWEAALTAAHYKLNNVIGIVDSNKLQIDGKVKDVKNVEPIAAKFKAFGWDTIEINGHDFNQIMNALDKASKQKLKPTMIIANTIKCKGICFMEDRAEWHGKALSKEQLPDALKALK